MPLANVRGVAQLRDPWRYRSVRRVAAGRPAGRVFAAARWRRRSPRPATGSSSTTGAIPACPSIMIDGESENQEWADDLYELLREIDAAAGLCRRQLVGVPAGAAPGVAASGGGARPLAVAGDRRSARGRAPDQPVLHLAYRGGSARRHGGGVPARPLERGDRDQPAGARRADGVRPEDFIARMERWRRSFQAGAEHPVIGLSPAELRSMTMPACIAPGMDPVHPLRRGTGRAPADAECRISRRSSPRRWRRSTRPSPIGTRAKGCSRRGSSISCAGTGGGSGRPPAVSGAPASCWTVRAAANGRRHSGFREPSARSASAAARRSPGASGGPRSRKGNPGFSYDMPILVSRVAARRFTGLGFGKAAIRLCRWQTNWTCRRNFIRH